MQRHARNLIKLIEETVGQPKLGCEVGVWRGHTSEALLRHFPNLTFWCIDPWEAGGDHTTMPKTLEELRQGFEEFQKRTEFAKTRRIVHYTTSREAAKQAVFGSFDFVFIDGSHLFEHVYEDVGMWHPKVRVGGLLCGHDYNGVGDKKGKFGVKQAVDKLLGDFYTIQTRPGLLWYVIVKGFP